jgi:hypothetical protein
MPNKEFLYSFIDDKGKISLKNLTWCVLMRVLPLESVDGAY